MPDLLFVGRVNVLEVAYVIDDRHATVRDCGGRGGLCLPEFADHLGVAAVIVGGDLDKVEGQVVVLPDIAPTADQRLHSFGVEHSFAAVGFALVPDCTPDRKRMDGVDHAV